MMLAALIAAALAAAPTRAPATPVRPDTTLPGGQLRVRGTDGKWRTWWTAGDAPARWPAPSTTLGAAVRWRTERPGLEVAELPISVGAAPGASLAERAVPTLRVRVVLVRLDPARHTLALHAAARPEGGAGPWDLDRAPAGAALAVNAGQFTDAGPWGWVVHRGRELQAPGVGPLSASLVVDDRGQVRIVPADSVAALRSELQRGGGSVVEAVQSYPALLDGDGALPDALRAPGRGVDLAHRDARLAVCELRDGRLLLALTRFDAGLGDALGAVPLGLTVPETAALMGALDCRRAMMLDGGLSAQMLVRGEGAERRWDGMRQVPLGLVATPRR